MFLLPNEEKTVLLFIHIQVFKGWVPDVDINLYEIWVEVSTDFHTQSKVYSKRITFELTNNIGKRIIIVPDSIVPVVRFILGNSIEKIDTNFVQDIFYKGYDSNKDMVKDNFQNDKKVVVPLLDRVLLMLEKVDN